MFENPRGILKVAPILKPDIIKTLKETDDRLRQLTIDALIYKVEDSESLKVEMEQLLIHRGRLEHDYPHEAESIARARPIRDQIMSFGQPAKHDFPMLDLQPLHDLGAFKRWLEKVGHTQVLLTPSYCGIEIELIYVGGNLHRAINKGCGLEGIDITKRVYSIEGIPQRIAETERVSIRGVVTAETDQYDDVFKRRVAQAVMFDGKSTPEIRKFRTELVFIPMEVHIPGTSFSTTDLKSILLAWNFNGTKTAMYSSMHREIGAIEEAVEQFKKILSLHTLPMDGIIVTVVDPQIRMELGYTSRWPEWSARLITEIKHVRI